MIKLAAVTFLALGHPAMLKIAAQCQVFSLVNKSVGVEATVDLDSCTTGIEMRDHHMKEKYLETAKFPRAVFKGVIPTKGPFTGVLTVHGKDATVQGEVYNGVVRFSTRVSNHGISIPSYMGISVADEVMIQAVLQ